ncbi:MAG: AAA family ATPase [Dehalogenimonas sp.]
MPLPSTPFYVESWLPHQGRLEIYAPAKTGKTFMGLQLARCLGAGEDFMGLKVQQARTLYLQFELGQEVFQQRLKSTKKHYPDVYVGTTFSLALDNQNGQTQLLEAMEAIQPKVLVLDPLYKVMEGDENNAQDVKKVTDFLDRLIGAYECSIVLVHHCGKDITRGGRGSSVLEGWPDSVVELKRVHSQDGQHHVKLTPKFLRHAALPPTPIEAVMKGFEFITDESLTKEDKIKDIIINSDAPFTVSGLAELVGTSARTVYNVVNFLSDNDIIEKISRGVYCLKHVDNDA